MKLASWLAQQRGRQAALAAHLNIKQPQVAAWLSGKRPVPLEHCPRIQQFTAGAVTCEELRPDQVEYFALIRAQAAANDPAHEAAPAAPAAPPPHHDTMERRRITDTHPSASAPG
jgi:DNA-binding transcriptional regulator YdaS (Cro superfamily)